ncbi:MAG: hydrogenase maturation nickel metallochaperone HypA [Anaerolineae bacterium]|nr:hydrogenase maturation nickel metallochaperone HypA [Anaerolineae bacterium]
MHELPLTEDILRIATQHAAGKPIIAIYLVIGDLTSFVDDAIQFYFDLIAPRTLAEGATLHFRRVAVRFRCRSCETEFAPVNHDWHCPACGALGGEVIAGKEFLVESIEVATEE